MQAEQIRAAAEIRQESIYDVPDGGFLTIRAMIDNAIKMHGLTNSPHREREACDRFLDIVALGLAVFTKQGCDPENYFAQIEAERSHQKQKWANDERLSQEDWLIILERRYGMAEDLRFKECVAPVDFDIANKETAYGQLLCVCAVAHAALENVKG